MKGPNLILHTTRDVTTVEICGALKNILVVAAGIVDGLGYGSNTKSAVLRLGMFEIGQYCKFMYAKYGESAVEVIFFRIITPISVLCTTS